FLWVAFDSKKQGWHDKFAGTVVVYRQKNHRQSMKIGDAFEKNDLEYRERHRLDPEDSKSKVEPELVPF
ncbi:MAG: RDD family protein, partial [Nitrospirae bacterium]|nr:RDD family protein [Nitrospirota bacterium]